MEGNEKRKRQEVFARVVKAGRRTYFFDVHQTKKGDLYLIITESKKFYDKKGSFHFKKHKIFLYKEDFEDFADAFRETVGFIDEHVEESLEKGGLEPVNQEGEKPASNTDSEPHDVSAGFGDDNSADKSSEKPEQEEEKASPDDEEAVKEKNPDKAFTDVDFDDLDDSKEDDEEGKKDV